MRSSRSTTQTKANTKSRSAEIALKVRDERTAAVTAQARTRNTRIAPTSIAEDGLLPLREAAAFCGTSPRNFSRLLASGAIKYVRLTPNGDRLTPKRAIIRFIEERLAEQAGVA